MMLLWLWLVVGQQELKRPYTRCLIVDLVHQRCPQTHIQVEGIVTLVRKEPDGDWHIRVSDGAGHWCIAEIVPTLQPKTPFTIPKRGDRVRIRGIQRYDAPHRWHECGHPVEQIEVLK